MSKKLMMIGLMLVAAPAMAHKGMSNQATWDACATATLSDECSFTDHHENLHRGTCRSFGGNLSCVRNQPLIKQSELKQSQMGGRTWGGLLVLVGGLLAMGVAFRNQIVTTFQIGKS